MIILLFFIPCILSYKRKKKDEFTITVTPNNTGSGYVHVDWSSYESKDNIFKVYRSSADCQSNFEMIPIDHTQVTNVKCLHVYPESAMKDQLTNWMKDFGQNIITVSPVSIEEFNSDPSKYLFTENNEYNYDVIFFWNK